MLTRATAAGVSTFNAEDRTVEVCWSTGAKVKRYSWDEGYYMEELVIEPDAIRLDRFDAMSLLDSHDNNSMAARLGTVVPGSVRIEKGKAFARIKFSKKQAADDVFCDLQDGHPVNISVGYKIHHYEKTEGADGQLPVLRAVDWEPLELSAVPIPADPGASSRSNPEDTPMTDNAAVEPRQPTQYAIRKERERVNELRALAHRAQMEDAELDAAIEGGVSVDTFRHRALEVMIARQEEAPTFPHRETPEYLGRRGENPDVRAAMVDALLVRTSAGHQPKADAHEFIGLSLAEIARRCLESAGIRSNGMYAPEVVRRALHTTSDFSHVISNVGQTVLAKSYQAAPNALKVLARPATVKDFRSKTTARLSGFADLEQVNEHGEYKRGTYEEGAESYRVLKFGKVFGMSFELILADQLNAFADVARDLGASAARKEAELLAGLINSNPPMADGKGVFHADHKNLAGTGATLSETTLSAARLAMMRQTGLAGELIDVVPKYLVVSPESQTDAEKLLATIQPATTADVNPFAGRLQLVVDRRLSAAPWHLVADPDLVPSLEFAHIEGMEGPSFETREGFDVDGVETKVRLICGGGWIDHRGWFKNPGT